MYYQWVHTQTHVCNTWVYTQSWPHRPTQTDTLSTHANTKTTNGLILFLCLTRVKVGQWEMHIHSVDPCRCWTQTLNRSSSCSWISFSLVVGIWVYKPQRLQLHVSCCVDPLFIPRPPHIFPNTAHTHRHIYTHTQKIPQQLILDTQSIYKLVLDLHSPQVPHPQRHLHTQKHTCTSKSVMVVSQNPWSPQQMSGTSQPYKNQLLLWSYSSRHTTPGSHAMSPTHQLTQRDLHKDSH